MMPFMLFSGFYANLATIPAWLGWFQWCSPVRYSTEAFLQNEYSTTKEGEFDILHILDMSTGLWTCIIVLICIAALSRVLANLSLKLLTKRVE
jgi:hypothetical protein